MLATDSLANRPPRECSGSSVITLGVEIDTLEEPALVPAAVCVEVLERQALAWVELIGQVAHDAELGLLAAGQDVVRARVLERAGAGDTVEAAILLDEVFLVRVRHAGDKADLLPNRLPSVALQYGRPAARVFGSHDSRACANRGDVVRAKSTSGCDTHTNDLSFDAGGKRASAVVISQSPAPQWAHGSSSRAGE